ncbi:MAG: hypothetical protein QGH15_07355 [Kiritimatiellia bacterium]|jgi:hypothetical protein|nr:hypothetical protein [Kiritimatiellia bacterium]
MARNRDNIDISPVIVLVFVACTTWFIADPQDERIPYASVANVSKEDISTAPIRTRLSDPPMVHLGGYDRDCNDCHRIFKSLDKTPNRAFQHVDIKLNHGRNSRCFNCHAKADRNRLTIYGEMTVSYDQSEQLCAKCHGTTFKDWNRGIHGRTMGSWQPHAAGNTRLKCVECHNPHSPAYLRMKPLPSPHTLRMGEPSIAHATEDSPLTQWILSDTEGAH